LAAPFSQDRTWLVTSNDTQASGKFTMTPLRIAVPGTGPPTPLTDASAHAALAL
jgi:hypothetical protein